MHLDRAACYQAITARDARFDGRFFTAVRTTGIYCRPICPARLPKLENVVFYPSAASAQEAGFRPCLVCRPENAPDPVFSGADAKILSRVLALIDESIMDENAVAQALATRLGLDGERILALFEQHFAATPASVARTRRVLLAKRLVQDTALSTEEIARAARFGSARRLEEALTRLYGRPLRALRRQRVGKAGGDAGKPQGPGPRATGNAGRRRSRAPAA